MLLFPENYEEIEDIKDSSFIKTMKNLTFVSGQRGSPKLVINGPYTNNIFHSLHIL